jgi:hypothetical protein
VRCEDPGVVGRIVKISLAAALAALVLGMYLGNKVPFGAKKLSMVEAVARLEDKQTGLVLADEKDGDRKFAFNVADIIWEDGSEHGEGNPPCLREKGKEVNVEIGALDVAVPEGPTVEDVAVFVRCP